MVKKIPLRKCVVTQERLPKKDLLRIVKNNEGEVQIAKSENICLKKRSAGRIGVKFVERQIFVNKVSSMNW